MSPRRRTTVSWAGTRSCCPRRWRIWPGCATANGRSTSAAARRVLRRGRAVDSSPHSPEQRGRRGRSRFLHHRPPRHPPCHAGRGGGRTLPDTVDPRRSRGDVRGAQPGARRQPARSRGAQVDVDAIRLDSCLEPGQARCWVMRSGVPGRRSDAGAPQSIGSGSWDERRSWQRCVAPQLEELD